MGTASPLLRGRGRSSLDTRSFSGGPRAAAEHRAPHGPGACSPAKWHRDSSGPGARDLQGFGFAQQHKGREEQP